MFGFICFDFVFLSLALFGFFFSVVMSCVVFLLFKNCLFDAFLGADDGDST